MHKLVAAFLSLYLLQPAVAEGTKRGKLYYLDCSKCVHTEKIHTTVTENLWHRRYGHLSSKYLQLLARKRLVVGLDYDCSKESDSVCESCVEGKQHKNKFTSSERRAKEPLELVHSDVCGKLKADSLSGGQYFLTFIDDYTRYIWVYILKHKSEVFARFKEWKALVEKSTEQKLKFIRTDNGGEYLSIEFQEFLKAEGVKHERTIPKNPEQNGVAERLNQTLVETTRSMLANAKLPKKFWAEALVTASYLCNRSPTKALAGKTPHEAWNGEKPHVHHLRVFGCAAYAHIPNDERKKLDPISKRCILLGYGTEVKGYRLYDPVRCRVIFSRDVVFNESKLRIEENQEKKSESHRIEIQSDSGDQDVSVDSEIIDKEVNEEEMPELRRSQRTRQKPDYYGVWVNAMEDLSEEPTTFKDALASPDRQMERCNAEGDSIIRRKPCLGSC